MNLQEFEAQYRQEIEKILNQLQAVILFMTKLEATTFKVGQNLHNLSQKVEEFFNEQMQLQTSLKGAIASKRILLVEDNDINRQMLNEYLVFCGYQVLSLANGSGFFQALAEFRPNLILLDLKFLYLDGYTLIQLLQKRLKWQHIPLIVISAFAFKSDRENAYSLGASRYFLKPVNPSDLKQAIQEELYGFKT